MAKEKQKTLVLFEETVKATAALSNEQFGELMRAVFEYRFHDVGYSGKDSGVAIAFGFIASQVDRAVARSEERSLSGAKGGIESASRRKLIQANASYEQQNQAPFQSSPVQSSPIQSIPFQSSPVQPLGGAAGQTDRLTDRPSVSDVTNYASAAGQPEAVAHKFWKYNEERGWTVKDWKKAFDGWAANERELARHGNPNGGTSTVDRLMNMIERAENEQNRGL